ncbi:MAG: hypothetical protein J5651_00320 [Salinivirgaceae bacterium]|nr:hypothetical protein [Salinivirgaceae bacterium]
MRNNITFNDVPSVLGEMQTEMRDLKYLMKQVLQNQENGRTFNDDTLVFGIFRRKELIRMNDKRLYSEPTSPFKNYKQVFNAKERGCPFTRPAGMRSWFIKATDLEKWFSEWGKTEIPKEPININL